MEGRRKTFDKVLHREYDEKARRWFAKILPSEYKCKNNPAQRGIDIHVYASSYIFNVEVEIKAVWVGKKFPYKDVNLPKRKEKYCQMAKPTLFVVFNKSGSAYLCFWSSNVLSSPLKIVPNKFVRYGEKFYKIPLSCTYSNIKDAIDERYKRD